ncbi:FAD-dependent oxidoreductase [Aneurinibacillus sp. REN35]|uniref:FAD-dependent oxidoreductase n=1 Tax=Aneurinibacillus sp. REN35 TaxID=3237286 RepID=UPI003528ABB9
MTERNTANGTLPQFPESYWRNSITIHSFPALTEDIQVDVAVIGGGITGVTAAYVLANEGVRVALLDAGTILNGTTGHTTAKITAQHDLLYDELIQHLGVEKAGLYYKANEEALRFIQHTVKENNIDCDFAEEDAYIYTSSDEYLKKLDNEYAAYEKLGIPSEYTSTTSLPYKIRAAIVMKNQAQFHPLAYLTHLVQGIIDAGGTIYENTTAVDIEEGEQTKVITRNGRTVTCNYVLSCSHFPFHDGMGFYFARLHAERSYVLAVKTEKEFPGGMYLSAEEPKRSLRYVTIHGDKFVLIGGENHKTGQGLSTIKYYEALEAFGRQTFGILDIPYRWSAQDLITLDNVPYVGRITSGNSNVFVATGYRKWGMTNGTAAALLLRDLVMEKDSPYSELYSPSRFKADPSLKTFITQNADVAKHLIAGKLEIVHKKPEELGNDEGSVVTVDGKRAGAYRDENGTLHVVDTTCTHMGCELEWNTGERTWDCPCHASRFSFTGDVVEGPAEQPLKKLTIE